MLCVCWGVHESGPTSNLWQVVVSFCYVSPRAWDSGHQAWCQVPLPAEPSHWPLLYNLEKFLWLSTGPHTVAFSSCLQPISFKILACVYQSFLAAPLGYYCYFKIPPLWVCVATDAETALKSLSCSSFIQSTDESLLYHCFKFFLGCMQRTLLMWSPGPGSWCPSTHHLVPMLHSNMQTQGLWITLGSRLPSAMLLICLFQVITVWEPSLPLYWEAWNYSQVKLII